MSRENTDSVEKVYSRRKTLRAVSSLSVGAVLVPSVASADQQNESTVKDDSEGVPTNIEEFDGPEQSYMESTNVREVPRDELPISSKTFGRGGLTVSSLPECIGIPFEGYLEAQVCPKDDGSVEVSVGILGVAEDTLTISPGEGTKTGGLTAPLPGVPGTLNRFTHEWDANWSGTTLTYLHVELELSEWNFGSGWSTIVTFDQTIVS